MSRWMRWGLAAAAALALAPAAIADEKMERKADETKAEAKQEYGEAKSEAKQGYGEAKSEAKEAGQDVRTSSDQAKQRGQGAATRAGEKTSRHDNTDVITKLYTANILEVETAKIAKDKSNNESIKQFADQMEKDHGSLGDKLKELASNRNAKLDDDKALETHKAHIDKMKGMSEQEFDQHFREMMVQEHDKLAKEVKTALDRAKKDGDNELVSVLQTAQTKIKEHHHLAMDLGKDKGQRAGRRAGERGAAERSGSMERGTSPSGTTGGQSGTGTMDQPTTTPRGDSGQSQGTPSGSPPDRSK